MIRHRVLILYAAVFLFMAFTAVRRTYTRKTDFDGFWRAGRAVLEGRDPYQDTPASSPDTVTFPSLQAKEEGRNDEGEGSGGTESAVKRYLPFFGLLMAPLALLPMDAACLLWHLLSCAALLGSVWHAHRLLGRPRGLESPEALVALGATAVFWIASMTMGQIGLVTLYLSLAGVDFAQRGRPWLGGALVGLAAAIKVMPGILGVYFLLKRRWQAAAGAAAGFALCCALAVPVWGPSRAVDLHQAWRRDAAATAGVKFFELRESFRYQNQSLHAFLARTLMDVNAGRSGKPFHVNVADWPPDRVALVARVIQVPLLLMMLAACLARRAGEPLRLSEFAFVNAITTFLSPIAWTFHMAILLPAYAGLWEDRREKESRIWMGISLVLQLGIAHPRTRALGFLTWSCLAAAIGCWRIAMRERQAPPAASSA
ncbi:MAG: DUF2029 domain-containing protein [Planctomycetes bacterium]|nr:DUF2029 domain-containing protein [Planctomycetota bacterium]